MYGIRDDAASGLLILELSGRVGTAEAARAVSQAFALAEAGNHCLALCDLRGVTGGPEEPSVVASLIHARKSASLRVAFVGNPLQLKGAHRLARLAAITRQCGLFSREGDAQTWLRARAANAPARVPTTDARHLEAGLETAPAPALAGRGSAA